MHTNVLVNVLHYRLNEIEKKKINFQSFWCIKFWMHLIIILFTNSIKASNINRNRIAKIMWYFLFLFYLFIWYCILTEEKGVDLGQKKDSYFDNCCHNWPITGKTAESYDLFWDDWRLSVFYTPQSIRRSVLLFLFSVLLCSMLRLGFWKRRRWRILPFLVFKQWTFFSLSGTLCGPENIDWSKYQQCMAIHFTKKKKTPSKL